ncbi:hypothetical protein B484DRAFT_292828 [Ochromonadaceae sp. CCMP2298]|nr:hypothetical protein B484DRAFT_292828 [Ochromonadaceae sp. CCMP2298]
MASMVEETETETQPMKLDFRFADEMDSMDIVNFVNLEYAVEHTGPYSFRREGPVVGVEEVEGDLTSMPVKWLVLETPQPEEKIVGCARLRYEGGDGRVDVLCADSAGTGVVYRNVLRRMLSKVRPAPLPHPTASLLR